MAQFNVELRPDQDMIQEFQEHATQLGTIPISPKRIHATVLYFLATYEAKVARSLHFAAERFKREHDGLELELGKTMGIQRNRGQRLYIEVQPSLALEDLRNCIITEMRRNADPLFAKTFKERAFYPHIIIGKYLTLDTISIQDPYAFAGRKWRVDKMWSAQDFLSPVPVSLTTSRASAYLQARRSP